MNQLENDLICHVTLLSMLEHQKHLWSNSLALTTPTDQDERTRIEFILDSIDAEIERQQALITYIGNFTARSHNVD